MAKTAVVEELELEPGHMPPAVNLDRFGFLELAGDGHSKRFAYYSRSDSLIEICTPGYFSAAREFGLRTWDVIDVTYGDDPRTAKEVRLRVIEAHSAFDSPVKVGKVGPVRQCTPVEHGVDAAEPEMTVGDLAKADREAAEDEAA